MPTFQDDQLNGNGREISFRETDVLARPGTRQPTARLTDTDSSTLPDRDNDFFFRTDPWQLFFNRGNRFLHDLIERMGSLRYWVSLNAERGAATVDTFSMAPLDANLSNWLRDGSSYFSTYSRCHRTGGIILTFFFGRRSFPLHRSCRVRNENDPCRRDELRISTTW